MWLVLLCHLDSQINSHKVGSFLKFDLLYYMVPISETGKKRARARCASLCGRAVPVSFDPGFIFKILMRPIAGRCGYDMCTHVPAIKNYNVKSARSEINRQTMNPNRRHLRACEKERYLWLAPMQPGEHRLAMVLALELAML